MNAVGKIPGVCAALFCSCVEFAGAGYFDKPFGDKSKRTPAKDNLQRTAVTLHDIKAALKSIASNLHGLHSI
jgi:hypothetical protein